MNDAAYMTEGKHRAHRSGHFRSALSIIVAALALVAIVPLLAITAQSPDDTRASAFTFSALCGDGLGHGMSDRAPWDRQLGASGYPGDEQPGRRLTAQEAFQWSTTFVQYYGTSGPKEDRNDVVSVNAGPQFVNGPTGIAGLEILDNNDDNGKASRKRIHEVRSVPTCTAGAAITAVANGVFNVTQVGTSLLSSFTSSAFDTNIVCEEPGKQNQGHCVDLLFILGGDGTQAEDGVIGSLTSSIYMPLLALVAVAVGVWVFFNGIVQRKIREALWGVLWAAFAIVVGLSLLLNPALLAKAPATVSNALSGCVISAFGGSNCTNGVDEATQGTASKDVCAIGGGSSSGVDAASDSMQKVSSGLTCKIWKAFVLEPYAQASFGTSFEDLGADAEDPVDTRGKALVKKANRDNNEFCVNMTAGKSLKDMTGTTLETSRDSICNLALYQLSLLTDSAMDETGATMVQSKTAEVDTRWFKLVDVASADKTTWDAWAGGSESAGLKLFTAFLSMLTVGVGGFVLVIVSIFAILFYLSSILLMAFAPLFFLIGVHPGKGRKVLTGYAEMVISHVLKYVASALFLVVSLHLYAGVLESTTSPGLTLLIIIVLSLSLFLYRREVIDLIGTVNMGGTQAGKKTTARLNSLAMQNKGDMGRAARRATSVAVGSATGAAYTGGNISAVVAKELGRELKPKVTQFGSSFNLARQLEKEKQEAEASKKDGQT